MHFNEQKPSQKLDTILVILSKEANFSIEIINERLGGGIHSHFIREVVDKLIKDDNAVMVDDKYINITFDGRLLIEKGGYSEKDRIDNEHRYKVGIPVLLNVASVIVGAYYLFEIVRIYLMPIFQHVCSCKFVWQGKP